jgi:hypothetical protein
MWEEKIVLHARVQTPRKQFNAPMSILASRTSAHCEGFAQTSNPQPPQGAFNY